MPLLANGISRADAITVIVLCIAVIFFVFIDIILVLSLQRLNKRLVKKTDSVVTAQPDLIPQAEETEVTSTENIQE